MHRVSERLTGAITLPDGTAVRGRGRREPLPEGPLPQFGLYLGRPPDRQRRLPVRAVSDGNGKQHRKAPRATTNGPPS